MHQAALTVEEAQQEGLFQDKEVMPARGQESKTHSKEQKFPKRHLSLYLTKFFLVSLKGL